MGDIIMFSILKKKPVSQKNVLLLGNDGCGKRSFILHFKDKAYASERPLPPMETICYDQEVQDNRCMSLNFVLDRSRNEFDHFLSFKKEKYHSILILLDLSTETVISDYKKYLLFASKHFKGTPVLVIGTKADRKIQDYAIQGMISTSAKHGKGFEEFSSEFMQIISDAPVKRQESAASHD
jgi:hypothetical protein